MLSHGNISVAGSDQQLRQKFFSMHIQLRNPYIQALSLILPQFFCNLTNRRIASVRLIIIAIKQFIFIKFSVMFNKLPARQLEYSFFTFFRFFKTAAPTAQPTAAAPPHAIQGHTDFPNEFSSAGITGFPAVNWYLYLPPGATSP